MLTDIGITYWNTPTFYPEVGTGETYVRGENAYLFWFKGLLDRMVVSQPQLVRADVELWKTDEPFFFDKLRLYVWSQESVFSGTDVAACLESLSDPAFWCPSHRRELLHLLSRRWNDLPPRRRGLLERRLVRGRPQYSRESAEDYARRSGSTSAMILGWLIARQCSLSTVARRALPRLRRADPDWQPQWDDTADASSDGRGGFVGEDTDSSCIDDAPVDQILRLARESTRRAVDEFVVYKPFEGLVKTRPHRAVAALTNAARRNDYPVEFWRSALTAWPPGERRRLVVLFGARIARLPREVAVDLGYSLFDWSKEHLSDAFINHEAVVLDVFDTLVDKVLRPAGKRVGNWDDAAAEGGALDSQVTLNEAIIAPAGKAAEWLLEMLKSRNPTAGATIPAAIKERLERLVAVRGRTAQHVVSVVASRVAWLDGIDPTWVASVVVPWFNVEHVFAGPAWNGFMYGDIPRRRLLRPIKAQFLRVFGRVRDWAWNDDAIRTLHQHLVLWCRAPQAGRAYINLTEARRALQHTDSRGREYSLWTLSRIVVDQQTWNRFGKTFLMKAWPKERRFQTERTSRTLVLLAENAGEMFPGVVRTVLPYLVPIAKGVTRLMRTSGGGDGIPIARRFPEACVTLLDRVVGDNPVVIPYGLDRVLEMAATGEPSLRQDVRWRRLNGIMVGE